MDCRELTYTFNDGKKFPLIGFGTYQINGLSLIQEVLDYALYAGYRSFDTATVYSNEEDIGLALKQLLPKYHLKREDIYITSKLPPNRHAERAPKALNDSLKKLDCGYLDLYLIHWPGQQAHSPRNLGNCQVRNTTWTHLVQAYRKGLVRSIGVSNYTVEHLEQLYETDYEVPPAVNQVELHPHFKQSELLEYCRKKGIMVQAYSSLGGTNNPDLLTDTTICTVAAKLNRTPAQVLLRWALQQGIGIIPKARTQRHIEDNVALNFDIPPSEMQALSSLRQTKYAWDPSVVL